MVKEKQKIKELDLVIAKKNQQYKKLRESREQLNQSLNESSISDSSKQSYRSSGNRMGSGKKTFVTSLKNRNKGIWHARRSSTKTSVHAKIRFTSCALIS